MQYEAPQLPPQPLSVESTILQTPSREKYNKFIAQYSNENKQSSSENQSQWMQITRGLVTFSSELREFISRNGNDITPIANQLHNIIASIGPLGFHLQFDASDVNSNYYVLYQQPPQRIGALGARNGIEQTNSAQL